MRSIYEAVVIYEFFQLLLVYLGDSESEQRHHLQSKPPRAMLAPFCCWRVDPGSRYFLMDCKIGVLQYVVVRPLTTIYAVAMERSGRFHPESSSPADGYFWFVLVNFVSTSVAMYMVWS